MLRETGQALDRSGSRLTDDLAHLEKYSRHRNIMPIFDSWPSYGNSYIAPNASIIGDVNIGNACSVWYGVIIRGDINAIRIYDHVYIGDNSVLHTTEYLPPGIPNSLNVGNNVYIGAKSTLYSCVVDEMVYLGEGCRILEGAKIERGAYVLDGSIVTPGT